MQQLLLLRHDRSSWEGHLWKELLLCACLPRLAVRPHEELLLLHVELLLLFCLQIEYLELLSLVIRLSLLLKLELLEVLKLLELLELLKMLELEQLLRGMLIM